MVVEMIMNLKLLWVCMEDCDLVVCVIGCVCAKDGFESTEEEYSNVVGEAT